MLGGDKMEKPKFLECEKWIIFMLMMFVGGYFGAFTYSIRGGVFCNAQTGNVVLLSMAVGNGQWMHALYFLIPISAYVLGAFFSEILPNQVKKFRLVRWDTLLVFFEMITVLFSRISP